MGILLLILKIIGIILLCILGLFLFVVLMLLFCPFTYNISAEGSLENISATAKFGWLFCLIRPIIIYKDNVVEIKVRIFGIPIKLSKTEVKAKKDDKTFSVPEPVLTEDDMKKAMDKMENEIDNTDSIKYNEEVVSEEFEEDLTDEEFEAELRELDPFNQNDEINVKPKQNPISSLKNKFKKTKKEKVKLTKEEKEEQKKQEAKEKREATKAKVKEMVAKVKEVKETLEDQKTKDAIALIKDVIIKCIKHIAPNRFKGHVEFGMEDPYVTGQILAAAAIIYPAFNGNLGIVPYFESEKTFVEGKVNIKGHVYMIYFIAQGIRVLKNKTIMGFIKKARK